MYTPNKSDDSSFGEPHLPCTAITKTDSPTGPKPPAQSPALARKSPASTLKSPTYPIADIATPKTALDALFSPGELNMDWTLYPYPWILCKSLVILG